VCPLGHVFHTQTSTVPIIVVKVKQEINDSLITHKTLEEALFDLMKGDNNNTSICDSCESKDSEERSMFTKLPNTLVFHIDRYSKDLNGKMVLDADDEFIFPVDQVYNLKYYI
jgi:ubiquitin C-terminal hydrolase